MEGRTQELRQGLYGCVSTTSTGTTKAMGKSICFILWRWTYSGFNVQLSLIWSE